MSNLLQDLRHSVRLLLKNPGFSLTAILVLALGIVASVALVLLSTRRNADRDPVVRP
jgi:hypothetical protein